MINGIKVSNLQYNLNQFTDWYTDDLFSGYSQIVFKYSRLCVDVERFKNDKMNKIGKGIFYSTDINGDDIKRRISNNTLMRLYNNHHNSLIEVIKQQLKEQHNVIIVDCHSFPMKPFPWENNNKRPDICIGIDTYHTPKDLITTLKKYFESCNLVVDINIPYVGTIIPNQFYKKSYVKSIMIEVNRNLYLNDKYNKNYYYHNIKTNIKNALNIINEWEIKE